MCSSVGKTNKKQKVRCTGSSSPRACPDRPKSGRRTLANEPTQVPWRTRTRSPAAVVDSPCRHRGHRASPCAALGYRCLRDTATTEPRTLLLSCRPLLPSGQRHETACCRSSPGRGVERTRCVEPGATADLLHTNRTNMRCCAVDVTNSFAVPCEEDPRDPRVFFLDHDYLEQ